MKIRKVVEKHLKVLRESNLEYAKKYVNTLKRSIELNSIEFLAIAKILESKEV